VVIIKDCSFIQVPSSPVEKLVPVGPDYQKRTPLNLGLCATWYYQGSRILFLRYIAENTEETHQNSLR